MRPAFWELPLKSLTRDEWEALCDGCGKCCLNKLEDEDTGEVAFTRVSCKLLDGQTCRCSSYHNRHDYVPECVVLTPDKIARIAYWLPRTCAYRLRAEGKPLEHWHPLISGDPESVHAAGVSVRGWTVSEASVTEDDWENLLIEDLS
ncbi:MAG: YcgN family cysteine cluster protein [Paracoccus sp. (in: a-proteobacteria)]|uniref:YcgN family cysteine cluster protein n=1 Tax=Paracoccus sp. TaxID=267 RepID=UPI0026E0F65B|nr:YcgN family cysteine cluster protein [Paracoccus sp. (in: a-proteobacteria)]MDO5630503.1 YcgN family cysteine cluster protein [Paracoccus sp. (in: a-proteobacteria)]